MYPHTLEELTSAYNSQKEQIKQLKEELESLKELPKCNHSCECTDCQWRCITCTTIQRESKLNNEIQSLKEELQNIKYERVDLHTKIQSLKSQNEKLLKVIDKIANWYHLQNQYHVNLFALKSILLEAEKKE